MREDSLHKIQELPGSVHAQFINRKGKRYGPYWYWFYRRDGKLKKVYIPAGQVNQVKEATEAYRDRRKRIQKAKARSRRAIAEFKRSCTELTNAIQSELGVMEIPMQGRL